MSEEIQEVEIKWPEEQQRGFSEAYSSGLQYALCNDDYQQATGFVLCKDFFQDAYAAWENKNKRSIYGFTYEYNVSLPLATKGIKILLANRFDAHFSAKMEKSIKFLNEFEEELGMEPKSMLYKCIDPPEFFKQNGVYLIEGSDRWLIAPPMLSLYTLLIRIGCKHLKKNGNWRTTCEKIASGEISQYQNNDQYQIQTAMKGINHILKHGDKKIFGEERAKNYPNDIETGTLHHYTGIVGFTQRYNPEKFPGWFSIPFEENANKTISAKACS